MGLASWPRTGRALMRPMVAKLRIDDAADGAGDFVFEQAFAGGIARDVQPGGDGDFVVELADAQAQVNAVAAHFQRFALHAVEAGGILGVGIGLGIEFFEDDFAFGGLLIFVQQVLDFLGVSLEFGAACWPGCNSSAG